MELYEKVNGKLKDDDKNFKISPFECFYTHHYHHQHPHHLQTCHLLLNTTMCENISVLNTYLKP